MKKYLITKLNYTKSNRYRNESTGDIAIEVDSELILDELPPDFVKMEVKPLKERRMEKMKDFIDKRKNKMGGKKNMKDFLSKIKTAQDRIKK